MKPALLSYLVCPACSSPLDLKPEREQDGEVIEGSLTCIRCGKNYPIVRGVPRFVPADLSADKRATASAFGYEWTHYSELTEADRAEFLDWIKPLDQRSFQDRVVLDAGCGKGRHLYLSARFGAAQVIGVDLSNAVESAYQNTRHLLNAHVVQADLYHLPLADCFDLAYSIGVLHHLPDPKAGFLSVVSKLKPGGRAAIWVYGKEGNRWIELLVNPLRIHVTSRIPKWCTRVISYGIAVPLYVALKAVYGPVSRRPGLRWMQRFLPYAGYLSAISTYSFAENFWNVFDHLVAPTAFYHSRQEMEDWLATAGLGSSAISRRNDNSWRATGIKSAQPSQVLSAR